MILYTNTGGFDYRVNVNTKNSKSIPHWATPAKLCRTERQECGAQLRLITLGQHSSFLRKCGSVGDPLQKCPKFDQTGIDF